MNKRRRFKAKRRRQNVAWRERWDRFFRRIKPLADKYRALAKAKEDTLAEI